jgi:signal transduction histidine kinase
MERLLTMGLTVLLIVVAVALTALLLRERSRVAAAAREVAGWRGRGRRTRLGGHGGPAGWRALASAVDALGDAYHERGEALDRQRPWRLELVEALAQPALLFSAEGRLEAANAEARSLTGLGVEVLGLGVTEVLGATALRDAVDRVRETEAPLTLEVERGSQVLRASISLIGDETLMVLDDRTRERRVEEIRRNFVVNASHELKTPVTAIQTLAEALEVTLRNDPERSAALVKRLHGEAERLARLVSDLLDLRRLEDVGPMELVPIDLSELVRQTVADALPRAEARGITFEVDVPDTARLAGVRADLEAVVKNLVSNAVKYNRDGGSVSLHVTTAGGAHRLVVADTGIGIPAQDHARVFERFYRVDTARSRATGGTGLGLSIVRHAVERHGGSVQVSSALGEGTAFTVTLPIEARP